MGREKAMGNEIRGLEVMTSTPVILVRDDVELDIEEAERAILQILELTTPPQNKERQTLDEGTRQLIEIFRFREGWSAKEISIISGINYNTVHQQIKAIERGFRKITG